MSKKNLIKKSASKSAFITERRPIMTRKEFKKKFGMTPLELARKLREENGEELKRKGVIE